MIELHHQQTGLKCRTEVSKASHLHIGETVGVLKLSLAGPLPLFPLGWIIFQKYVLAEVCY